ncbi:hybrid sensor histidine kinase/response regulator [Salinirubrum litoreum]|uniref:histidine kinase n=1 Tax=Salinirubrum litoreum TaxID=1126234 RepID=A0ABD5RFB7_9EURY|nr:PAS domain S-box protein [Salinirubrum litoreum]
MFSYAIMSAGEPLGEVRVLVVDDDESMASLTAAFLGRQRDSFDVLTASSGDDALETLDRESVDCVVSDYEMPAMDGIELLRAVRDRRPSLPFVLFTGRGSEEIASEAISAGVTDYLQKGSGEDRYALLANRLENAVRQRRAEQIATETQRRLEEVTEHTNDVLYMFDGEFSELLFVNAAYESVYGQSVDRVEADPQAFMECIHPDDREHVSSGMARLVDGESVSMEYRVNAAEDYGRWVAVEARPVIEDGEVTRIVGSARDVTDQRERRSEIERSRERFRALFEESPDGIVVADDTGRIVQVNQTFVDGCGYDRETVRSMTMDDLDADGESSIAERWATDLDADATVSFESRYRHADGTTVPVEVWVTPLSTGDDQQYLATIRDVSDWQSRESRLDALYRTTQELLTATDRTAVAEIVVRAATDVLGLDVNSVYAPTDAGDRLVPLATSETADALFDDQPVFEPGESIAWSVYESGEDRIYEDVSTDPDRHNEETDIRAEMLLPLGDHGVFVAGSTKPAAFDEGTVRLARLLANTVETVLDRTESYAEVTTRNRKIQRLHESTDEIVRADSVEAVAEVAIETAETVLDVPFNGIHLVDEAGETLEPVAVSQAVVDHLGEAPTYSRNDPARSADRFNWGVFESGEPAVIDDTEAVAGLDASETPSRSGIVYPLGDHGIFVSTAATPGALTETDAALVELFAAVVTAVLDQLESRADLRAERTLLSNIFEQIPVHLFVKDTEARHLRVSTHLFEDADVDTDALAVDDFSPEAVEGKTDVELYRDTERYRESYAADLRVIETGEPLLDVEEYDSIVDEWFLTSKVPWYDEDGTCKGIMGVATEITTQKEYERRLERQNDRLESFASMVSHDLRNPLNVVQGRLQLALEDGDTAHLDPAMRAATRMGELIDDLLRLARQGQDLDTLEPVALDVVSHECWSVVDTSAASLTVETDATVRADRSRLAQVFENLFRNAVEHAGPDVSVTVGTTPHGFYVADDGPGMSTDDGGTATGIEYPDRAEGTGLGLTIVEEVAAAHGWEVEMRDSEAGGLCVAFDGVTFVGESPPDSS